MRRTEPWWFTACEWGFAIAAFSLGAAVVTGTFLFVVLPLEWWTGRKGRV